MKHAFAGRLSLCFAFVAVAAMFTLPGCSSVPRMKARQVVVNRPDDLKLIDVDIIGVSAGDAEIWRGLNVSKYFDNPDNSQRKQAKQDGLLLDRPLPLTIEESDPVWNEWRTKGVRYLVILANLSRTEAAGSSGDTRRAVIDLTDPQYNRKQILVTVNSGHVSVRAEKR